MSAPTDSVTKTLTGLESPWDLFDPGDYYETDNLEIFNRFLNSRGTCYIDVSFKPNEYSILIRGSEKEACESKDTSCVIFHGSLTQLQRGKRVEIVDSIFALPGLPKIPKDRIGKTLAAYFGVELP